MALLNRANLNSLLLLNHCYYKFATGTVRLKTRGRISLSSSLMQEKIKQSSEKKTESNVKSTMFETTIANRRDQARRSILVQVYSLNSQDDLQSYCAQFGDILKNGCTCPTEKEISNFLQNAKSISGQIIDLYEALKLSDLETRLRFHTAHHLEQYFSRLFQNTKVLPFGSSLNGFGRKRCDLDLVLISDKEESTTFMGFFIYVAIKISIQISRA
ncbi:poly(A) RNA polymerase, mitochondrial-like [Formica exsecta]|uniref:poly(A) RNA polymerase, mitochondrial-like n=1 Tax=Formica exsecta TaxID=72781 RepID=UPI0011425CC3|nr:poly(A) RNA polymerase, mitochondrial-like [Formica exsecta]